MCVCMYVCVLLSASQNDKSLLVSSVRQYSAHNVTGGLGVVAYLSTAGDLTKQVRRSFAPPIYTCMKVYMKVLVRWCIHFIQVVQNFI